MVSDIAQQERVINDAMVKAKATRMKNLKADEAQSRDEKLCESRRSGEPWGHQWPRVRYSQDGDIRTCLCCGRREKLVPQEAWVYISSRWERLAPHET